MACHTELRGGSALGSELSILAVEFGESDRFAASDRFADSNRSAGHSGRWPGYSFNLRDNAGGAGG